MFVLAGLACMFACLFDYCLVHLFSSYFALTCFYSQTPRLFSDS